MKKDIIISRLKGTGRYTIFKNLLDNKAYDEIYRLFGKTIYMLFTPADYKKKDIQKLLKDNNLAEIYNKYGKIETLLIKNFRRLNKQQIQKLIKERRYIELYNLYGEEVAYKYRFGIYESDVEYETGSKFKAKLYRTKKVTAYHLKESLSFLATLSSVVVALIGVEGYMAVKNIYKENLIENAQLIQEYDEGIQEYAYNVQQLELDSDLEVVMKVMYDMWNNMQYGAPSKDITNFGRLAFAGEEKVGVCRNMADDFSARMNAINPDYNARNLVVYMDKDYYSKESLANINRNILSNENETFIDDSNTSNNSDNTKETIDTIIDNIDLEKYVGNHMVSIFDPIGKDYTLVVDVTNPSIGIISNGQIFMFSTIDGKGLTYKPLGQFVGVQNYDINDIKGKFIKSYISFTTESEFLEITNEWNIEKQNEALKYIIDLSNERKK